MKLTFDDVLIKPRFSAIDSRKEVDLTTRFQSGEVLALPLFSANMATVTGPEMSRSMLRAGGMAIMHRFYSPDVLATTFIENSGNRIWWSFGVGSTEIERVERLYRLGARKFCLDVAHGAQMQIAKAALTVKDKYPDIQLMVGNFATGSSIEEFHHFSNGASNIYKVGIGPGSMCTTRIKTGCGIPQLTAIQDCVKTGHDIIADGGIKTAGDVAKALGAGAKAVMIGGLLAGTDESPGEIKDGKKVFHGSAWKASAEKNHRTSEGEKTLVPAKGPVEAILNDIEGGLRSAFCYVGARNLTEFQSKVEFIEISANTRFENGAHGK
jgi:IMP dehydrogenase